MNTLQLSLANINIQLATNFPGYYNYLSSYFEKVLTNHSSPQIDVLFDFSEQSLNNYLSNLKKSGDFVAVGANTLIGENQVVTVRKLERKWKVLFHISQEGQRLKVIAKFQNKPLKDFFRFGPMNRRADEFFFMITYYLLYYPLFWYLEEHEQKHALHASALMYKNKGIVICGLEGIGKTSLGLMFLKEEGSRFLSDNLVFYGREGIYPCYELVRMHSTDESIWKTHFERVNKFDLLKGFFSPKFDVSQEGVTPDVMIFPEFSSKFFANEISQDEAVSRAIVLSHLPAELNNYSEYRHLYNLLNLEVNPWSSMYSVLGQLLSNTKCYRVGMPKNDGLELNFQNLKGAIFHE